MTLVEPESYVHGYTAVEQRRLLDQANTLAELLHRDTTYPAGSRILEAGCGVGAQTSILVQQSPKAEFTAVDQSAESLAAAKRRVQEVGCNNAHFVQADLYALPFPDASFDHVFVCFVLEHLTEPERALLELGRVLKSGGTLTVIEGDHGSAYYHPASPLAQRTIDCLVTLQTRLGGNSLIGRQLFPLLHAAGYRDVRVEPRVVYADASRAQWVSGFTQATFIAMVEGVKAQALAASLIDEATWDRGILDLKATAGPEGTFNYTFFKAVASR